MHQVGTISQNCFISNWYRWGVSYCLCNLRHYLKQFSCDADYIFRDATRWLRCHGAPSQNIFVYFDDIRTLFHLQREDSYTNTLAQLKRKWRAPFLIATQEIYIRISIQLPDGALNHTRCIIHTVEWQIIRLKG